MRILKLTVAVLFFPIATAAEPWQFAKVAETEPLTRNKFYLNTVADFDRNGRPEIIATDFGNYPEVFEGTDYTAERPDLNQATLYVLEWDPITKKLVTRFSKHWNTSTVGPLERERHFAAWRAERLIPFPISGGVFVQSVPAFFGLEWKGDQYVLHEQHYDVVFGKRNAKDWIFPWQWGACATVYFGVPDFEYECLLGIRNFPGDDIPRIVTRWQSRVDRPGPGSRRESAVRVRKWQPEFPIEWEQKREQGKRRIAWSAYDAYNIRLKEPSVFGGRDEFEKDSNFLFELTPQDELQQKGILGKTYGSLRNLISSSPEYRLRRIETTKFEIPVGRNRYPDIQIRFTRNKDTPEFWGYGEIRVQEGGWDLRNVFPQRAVLRKDLTGWDRHDIRYQTHNNWIGTGHLLVADLDGDGLDEVLFVEETGKRTVMGVADLWIQYRDTKDYIHILKWNGKEYQTMWVSPPYPGRGSKLIVEDVMGSGKKQLIVLNANGRIEVWERK